MPGERVQVQRLRGDERLPLAGLHLGDVALVEDDPAHQLDVEQALVRGRAWRASRTAAKASKSSSSSDSPFSSRCLNSTVFRGELGVGELLEVGLERGDVGRLLGEPLDAPAFAGAQYFLESRRGPARACDTG